MGTVTITGLALGAFEVLYLSHRFDKSNLLVKVILKTLIYLSFIILFLILNTLVINSMELESPILSAPVLQSVLNFVNNLAFWSIVLYIAATIWISLFYAEVSANIGQEALKNFITGKYHRPRQEARIFMFLDMKSSTTIAEKIGHVRYFEMLKEYYSDLSDPVVQYGGEIYQYVGDEMIVTWDLATGLKDNNCIKCFFAMKDTIRHNAKKYLEKFEIVPSFKAGIHYGQVTAGEIGKIKKNIIYTGDVLNTTARIQGLCNTLEVEILVSANLVDKLKQREEVNLNPMGTHQLRGRGEKIDLFTVMLQES